MADGSARASGELGCCLVVPGPGVLNAMSGLATAYACSSPVLCVAGQVHSQYIDAGLGVLHEIPHQLDVLRSVTKWAGRAGRPEEVPAVVFEAVRQMRTARPRPAAVEGPPDVLEAAGEATPPHEIRTPPPRFRGAPGTGVAPDLAGRPPLGAGGLEQMAA